MYADCMFLISLMRVHLSRLDNLPPEFSVNLLGISGAIKHGVCTKDERNKAGICKW